MNKDGSRLEALLQWFQQNYLSIAELDLHTGTATVLKTQGDPDMEGVSLPWDALIKRYVQRRTYVEDRDTILALNLERMQSVLQGGGGFPIEARCLSHVQGKAYEWVEIDACPFAQEVDKLIVTTRNIGDERIMRRIIDLYVYQNFDYFTLLDTKNNSYVCFGGNAKNTPVPPPSGADYESEMASYNRQYVAPEDYERVTASMQINHICQMLDSMDRYHIYTGVIGADGQYHRTMVQFTYYDKIAGLVLVSRSDITQIYLEEQEKNQRLAAAMQAAQHDSLTGLYNQKASSDLVTRILDKQYHTLAALLFIDVDNFKLVNDTLGHQTGDQLLCALGKFLNNMSNKAGIAGRIGGDEFLLFLPSPASLAEVEQRALEICRMFGQYQSHILQGLPITCSVGISLYPQDGTGFSILLQKADHALYSSKRYGKNQCFFYSREALQRES